MRLTGLPTLFDIDPISTSTVQNMPLGALGYDAIGRGYRYVKAGAVALVAGNLLQSAARDTQFTDMAMTASAAGQSVLNVTNGTTTVAAGDFTNGTLAITSSTGIGQNFVIKSHSTGTSGAALTFTAWENITVALTTSSKATVNKNLFDSVIVSPTTRTGKTVGVAMSAIPIAGFGWIGVKGIFGVLSDSTVAAVGESLSPSTTTAGCVTKQVTLLETIGSAALLGISAKCEQAYLDLL
jgi:hypothetical protein